MNLAEELLEKTVDAGKEIILYTPSGAAILQSFTILPGQVTHLIMIICCPLVVMVVKGHRDHYKEHRHVPDVHPVCEADDCQGVYRTPHA